MEIKKLRFTATGAIDCEINHPAHGWIPFTASPDDASGQEIHARALAGEYGEIQAYVKPDNEPLTVEQVQALRREAYAAESDPLKNEAEYDALSTGLEPDYTAWIAAVQAIKARYPLPETISA
ncbi:hypothetical protein [Pseudomonas sp. B392_1p]|uniref:hypothetical protein n=1 Tax=Pseudomonas sp. B392_1p TaxID=3457507 RepID=UPI003FD5F6EF